MTQVHFDLQPVLENGLVLLRPLQPEDFENLCQVASDPLIWEQHPAKERATRDGFTVFFNEAMATGSAFVVIDKTTGQIIGTTRFYPVNESPNAIEIGWTFLARAYWGGQYNGVVKRLMLDYAFKYVDNVLFCIHEHNFRSQKAVEKIGGERVYELDGKTLVPRTTSTIVYKISKNTEKQ